MASRFPAAIKMKSHGTASVFVKAPLERSDLPLIGNSLSCIAVSNACCSSSLSKLTSSMYSTPLWALCMAPGSTLSWAGVSMPPDWKGSCLTSPSKAPLSVAVASTNGGFSLGSCLTNTLGILEESAPPNLDLRNMYPNTSKNIANIIVISPPSDWRAAKAIRTAINPNTPRRMFCIFFFCSFRASFCIFTILSPLPAGTLRTLGSFSSSSLG